MKLAILLAALLPLGACASATNTAGLNSFITTLSQTNCHVTGSLSAQIGAMNPGSGASLTTMIDCPNGGASTTATTTVSKPTAAPVDAVLNAPTNAVAP